MSPLGAGLGAGSTAIQVSSCGDSEELALCPHKLDSTLRMLGAGGVSAGRAVPAAFLCPRAVAAGSPGSLAGDTAGPAGCVRAAEVTFKPKQKTQALLGNDCNYYKPSVGWLKTQCGGSDL